VRKTAFFVREDPDFITAYVVNHILGGGSFTSRLYGRKCGKARPCLSVFQLSLPSFLTNAAFFLVGRRLAEVHRGKKRREVIVARV